MLTHEPEYSSCFSTIDFTGRSRVIVAVSGGSDSLALLFLFHDYLKQHSELTLELLAVTVDHKLRPESAAEAEQVGTLCAQHGIAHRIMCWEAPKPCRGVSQAAREARQDLLAQAAIAAGSDLVMLGHTSNDQAETTHMRMLRATGRGLAGIAPATLYNRQVWFIRPLLDAKRSDLRSFLDQRSIRWIDDPTNTDIRYERARVRQSLTVQASENLLEISTAAGEARKQHGQQAASFMAQHVRLCSPGLLQFPKAAVCELATDTAIDLLRIMLAIAGGASHLPDRDRSAELFARMLRGDTRATLSRAVVATYRDYVYLHREFRNIPREPVTHGLIWDRRYHLSATGPVTDLEIAPVGIESAQQLDSAAYGLPNSITRAAFAAEPALWRGTELVMDKDHKRLYGISWKPIMGPWVRLVPSFDFSPAAAMLEVLGGGFLPKRPWHCHKQH